MEISSGDLCKYGYLEKKKQTMTRGIFGFREKAPDYRRPVHPGSLFGSRLSRASTSPASPVLPTSGMPGSRSARRTLEAAGISTGATHCKARGPRCRGLGSCNLTQAPPTIPVVSDRVPHCGPQPALPGLESSSLSPAPAVAWFGSPLPPEGLSGTGSW